MKTGAMTAPIWEMTLTPDEWCKCEKACCPTCHGSGYTASGGTVIMCPLGCDIPDLAEENQKRLAAGETVEDILGLRPAGQSVVLPGSDHLGNPRYSE